MLFYNHKQEFIGIDEEGLKLLNYATFEALLNVCSDVADLFAKEPGYIHNFKSFGWIDFLLHADSDASSAIVHGNGRTFSCTLQVNTLFLTEDPSSPGYIIEMTHIQSLSENEIKPHPITSKPKPETKPTFIESPEPSETASSVLPNYDHITPTTLSEPGVLDVPAFNEPPSVEESLEDFYTNLSLPLNEEKLQSDLKEEPSISVEPEPAPTGGRPVPADNILYSSAEQEFIDALKVDKSYRFDPNVAAQELGLPVDLIQEFIGDFILQANEFKDELFEAALKGDMNNLKILSHKLKGVAANLRIEDAFECLSIINTSNDPIEIEANLKYFYSIVAKLEGKETSFDAPIKETENNDDLLAPAEESFPSDEDEQFALPEGDDIYAFDLKDDNKAPISEKDLYSVPSADDEIVAPSSFHESFEKDVPLSEKTVPNENPSTDLSSDDIYSFEFKEDHEPLIQEDDPSLAPSEDEENYPLSPYEEPFIQEENPYQTPAEEKENDVFSPFEESFETDAQPFEETVNEQDSVTEPLQTLHFDKSFIAGQMGIELDFFDELIAEYKQDALRAANEISAAINAFDTHAWKKTASQLKGISDNLRLNEISDELAILSQTNDAQEANKASKRLKSFLEQL